MTWADLIAAVRAQIDVSDDQAYEWLLERARVLNGESGWLTTESIATTAVEGAEEFPLPEDLVHVEAVVIARVPYKRSTPAQMDFARANSANTRIYAEIFPATAPDARGLRVWPPVSANLEFRTRYLADVPDQRDGSPPFPSDLQSILADGAIAIGLARMDERFDSAGYFDAKFADGIQRLRKRAHSHVGRGGTPIRLVS